MKTTATKKALILPHEIDFALPENPDTLDFSHPLFQLIEEKRQEFPKSDIKCDYQIPTYDDKLLEPEQTNRGWRWHGNQRGITKINNCCFFTALWFSDFIGINSKFIDVDRNTQYINTKQLSTYMRAGAFHDHGWLIGHFVFHRYYGYYTLRPFNPKKDKFL